MNFIHKSRYFKPQGIPLRELSEINLSFEEIEALRLRFVENLSQANAAKKMGISQSQYQRDLWEANKKITEAIIEGKALKVEESM